MIMVTQSQFVKELLHKPWWKLLQQPSPISFCVPSSHKRIPQELYKNTDTPCLIVHPGITGDRGMFSIDWALQDNAKIWGALNGE